MLKIKDEDIVCSKCGGTKLEHLAWVDYYTDAVLDGIGDYDARWCRDCEEHTDFITYREFKNKKDVKL